jgi:O-antigen ligase
MEAVQHGGARSGLRAQLSVDLPAIGAFLVPFALILFLALSNGGYDIVERSQAAIAVWWIVLIGTAVGALPVAGGTAAARIAMGLLAAFAGWTLLSLGWTESDERTTVELGRTFAYLGFFVAALAIQGEGRWRPLLHGITAATALVCGLAVLSRLEPNLFPERVTGDYLPGIEIERRLGYPLNYSSGLGALAAIAVPLLLAATSTARTIPAQCLAAAAMPLAALALWLTTSSLSLPAAAIGLVAFLVLAPDRLPKLGTLLVAGGGSAILFAAAEQREALDRGLPTPAALEQGDSMLAVLVIVCVGVGLVQAALSFAVRYGERPAWMTVERSHATVASGVALVAALVIGVTAGGTGIVDDAIDDFKTPDGGGTQFNESRGAQILDFNSSGRYQFWEAAADANATDRWKGIGPGTFEFWWAREGAYAGFIRDAHSLYMEALAELGIVGLLLIGGFVVAILIVGALRAVRATNPALRTGLAAATAGAAAFAAAAAVDWTWELGVLATIFVGLAAIALAGEDQPAQAFGRRTPLWQGTTGKLAIGALALAAIAAISAPLAAERDLTRSEAAVAGGELDGALAAARDAAGAQPYAASPHLQQALVLERAGDLEAAAAQARLATQYEATNWRTWFIRSRLEARTGQADAAVRSLRRARELNPNRAVLQPAP